MILIKVSVIITVYNGVDYLRECLNSILDQSLKEIELICVDDASCDGTIDLLKYYGERDNRIKIIRNRENRGAGASRNIGLLSVKGKYVIFLDADDYYERDMLRQAFTRADSYGADICIFKENSFFDNYSGERIFLEYPYIQLTLNELEKKGCFSPKEINDVLFNLWNGWAWDKLFRREFIVEKDLKFQEIKTSNDAYFVHSAMASAEKITYIDKIYVHHRTDVSSSLSNRRDYSWECCCLYLQKLKNYLVEHELFEVFERSFINWAADFFYWNFWTLNENSRKKLWIALKESLLDKFQFLKYEKKFFYNAFDYWFIHKIYESKIYEQSNIPIDEITRWHKILELNVEKIERIFQYLNEKRYCAAVWGVGKRGKIFLNRYGTREEIKKVYDEDLKKHGKKIKKECIIEKFSKETSEEIEFIFVMSSSYYKEVVEKVHAIKSGIEVLDIQSYLEPYLSFPVSLEACIS